MSLLDMSLAGGAMIAVIAAVRALTATRLPKATFTALWAVAVLRLLVPVSVPSAVSVYTWLAPAETAVAEAVETAWTETAPAEQVLSRTETVLREMALDQPANGPAADRDATAPAAEFPWGKVLWAGGTALFGAYFAACWLAGRRRFREAVTVEDEFVRRWQEGHALRRRVSVRLSGRVDAPVTYGLFRPVILLPADTDWRDADAMGFILAHEYAHIRRMDGLKKLVLTGTACLHWFNPAVWVMYLLANRDMELACDERVVRSMAGDVRAAYARTLIRMAEVRGTEAPMFSWFSANAMEERITSIMKTKKLTAWAVTLSLILTLAVAAVFGTSALAAEPAEENAPYDWGKGTVLFPLRPEDIGKHFENVSIQWWEPDDFARWVEAQKPLLEAAVGSRPDSGTIAADVVWTEERSAAVLAAYEDIAAALEAGTGKLSKTVAGGGQVVIAEGMDWGLPGGSERTVQGYDLEALMWCGAPEDWPQQPESVPVQTYSVEMEPGRRWVDFGPSQTQAGLLGTVRAYFQCMVQAGVMEDSEANDILENWWSLNQEGDLPESYLVTYAGPDASDAAQAAEVFSTPTPGAAEDRKSRYIWDLTSGAGVAYEAGPAEEADHLLDIQPYGYPAPVAVEYVAGVQSASSTLQPGEEVTVGSASGTYESLVIAHDRGRIDIVQRSLDGASENPVGGDPLDVEDGSFVTGHNGWTADGGTMLVVRNAGDTAVSIDAFLYEGK